MCLQQLTRCDWRFAKRVAHALSTYEQMLEGTGVDKVESHMGHACGRWDRLTFQQCMYAKPGLPMRSMALLEGLPSLMRLPARTPSKTPKIVASSSGSQASMALTLCCREKCFCTCSCLCAWLSSSCKPLWSSELSR